MPAAGIEGLVVKGAAQPYEPGLRSWAKVKRRDTIDVVLGAVIGARDRPEAIVVGLPDGDQLRIVGRSTPLKPHVARQLGAVLASPRSLHPWPEVISPGAVDRFNAGRDPVKLTLVEPLVVEVSADVALTGRSFRHAVRFIRIRPELDVADVDWPER